MSPLKLWHTLFSFLTFCGSNDQPLKRENNEQINLQIIVSGSPSLNISLNTSATKSNTWTKRHSYMWCQTMWQRKKKIDLDLDLLWSHFTSLKVLLFTVQSPYSWSWLTSVLSMTEQTTESRAGPNVSVASWSEINTYIHLVSRSEQRRSCPCSLISSRNWSRLSDKLRSNRNIIQNSWIQCLEVRDDTVWLIQNAQLMLSLWQCVSVLDWPDEVTYPLALCWLLIVQRCFECKATG